MMFDAALATFEDESARALFESAVWENPRLNGSTRTQIFSIARDLAYGGPVSRDDIRAALDTFEMPESRYSKIVRVLS